MMRAGLSARGGVARPPPARSHLAASSSASDRRRTQAATTLLDTLLNGLLLVSRVRSGAVRAVAAGALAAVAAPQMIARRENHERALAVKVFAFDEHLLFLQRLPLGLELTREESLTGMDRTCRIGNFRF